MTNFSLHTIDTAPAESKPFLENSIKGFGMIPNLHAVMAESPSVLEAYQAIHAFFQSSSFNSEELTVVWQTINVEHGCHYCVPAHTAVANMMSVDPAISEAMRNGTALSDAKLQTLREMTLSMTRNRGKISDAEMEKFFAAGYTKRHLLDIVLGLSQKVMSNYINHFAETPVDEPFAEFAWNGAA